MELQNCEMVLFKPQVKQLLLNLFEKNQYEAETLRVTGARRNKSVALVPHGDVVLIDTHDHVLNISDDGTLTRAVTHEQIDLTDAFDEFHYTGNVLLCSTNSRNRFRQEAYRIVQTVPVNIDDIKITYNPDIQ